ncbi:MAG: sulfite exporter TauE/SafE family protein [Pseudomonadota bacterium]
MTFSLETAASMLAETAMMIVMVIVFITGIVRGFSGFGSGMIIGPSTAAFFSPVTSLAMLTILDAVPTLTLVWGARRSVNWKEVIPIVVGYALLVPLGVWVLKTGDPITLRWFISISILIAVAILWSGWKYTGPRTSPVSFSFGGLGGFMGAAAALPGPPVLVYWLASTARAITVRANMIYYLFLTDLIVIVGYLVGDIYTVESVLRGLICVPVYFVGILIGTHFFAGASDQLYRKIAFIMILISAITSLPLLDSLLR